MDPSSPAFALLEPRAQARIYWTDYGWSTAALADEFGVSRQVIESWLNPDSEVLTRERARAAYRPRTAKKARWL